MHLTLITLRVLFAVGLVADEIGRRTRLPRVTLLVLLGVLIGPAGFDLLPDMAREWYDMVAAIALTMVAFLLGSALSLDQLKANGRDVLFISITVVVMTIAIVFGGLFLIGMALVAGYHFPAYQEMILNVAIITTVIFEVLGPIAAKVALLKNARFKTPVTTEE